MHIFITPALNFPERRKRKRIDSEIKKKYENQTNNDMLPSWNPNLNPQGECGAAFFIYLVLNRTRFSK